ncbi:MAG: hypothetical protein L0G70_09335, partial [Rubrobacter sp.]|nr:hypothetical protein [Rubrobacter sp.]
QTETEHPGTPRLYTDGIFNTLDGRALFAPTPHEPLREQPSRGYPLTLSTGRIKNQWHTMTRTGRSGNLTRALDGPFVELHPDTAAAFGVRHGEQTRVSSARGGFEARASLTQNIEPGTVFAPFHWGELWTAGGSVNDATHGIYCPASKQPELNGAAMRVEPVTSADGKAPAKRAQIEVRS